jgi:hypothetical protein
MCAFIPKIIDAGHLRLLGKLWDRDDAWLLQAAAISAQGRR